MGQSASANGAVSARRKMETAARIIPKSVKPAESMSLRNNYCHVISMAAP